MQRSYQSCGRDPTPLPHGVQLWPAEGSSDCSGTFLPLMVSFRDEVAAQDLRGRQIPWPTT
ncbi:MAG: hypothetical protein JWR85_4138 [Marmoricola sp.]|jgi:hypothetical protein|nr:hypothetical protein [Marmoricola sp.]